MNALVIGGGGREHALSWKLARSPGIGRVYCAPGNAGMRGIECIDYGPFERLADFAESHDVGLVMVGPEVPLCEGIVDALRDRGLTIFGPDRKAAQLEGSKTFAKDFMIRHGIPTAAFAEFTDAESAIDYARAEGAPIVIKADGLAAGKGVIVATTLEAAVAAIQHCFAGAFGEAGSRVVVEEFLEGEEASILAFVDHHCIKPLAASQDHKRIGEGDSGPNTGGMGAYSPAPVVDDAMWAVIGESVLDPFLSGCRADGLDYRGIIYAGLMITDSGPKVLEFNVRFGDPETQPILVRMTSDLAEAVLATVDNRLSEYEFTWSDDAAVCVTLASAGYPRSYEKGKVITGIEEAEAMGAEIFHAGTLRQGDRLVTAGGRVLGVTATGKSIAAAVDKTYAAVKKIHWDGVYFRRDIAHRATQL